MSEINLRLFRAMVTDLSPVPRGHPNRYLSLQFIRAVDDLQGCPNFSGLNV